MKEQLIKSSESVMRLCSNLAFEKQAVHMSRVVEYICNKKRRGPPPGGCEEYESS